MNDIIQLSAKQSFYDFPFSTFFGTKSLQLALALQLCHLFFNRPSRNIEDFSQLNHRKGRLFYQHLKYLIWKRFFDFYRTFYRTLYRTIYFFSLDCGGKKTAFTVIIKINVGLLLMASTVSGQIAHPSPPCPPRVSSIHLRQCEQILLEPMSSFKSWVPTRKTGRDQSIIFPLMLSKHL